MTDPAPTDEPDAIAYMTDVELETFARTVVAERGALAAALESTRAEVQRHETFMRAIAECRDDPASAIARNDIINGKAIIRAHDAEAERDAARAELAAERAKVQDYSERIDAAIEWARADADNYDMTGLFHALRLFREDSAALAAAQPTGETRDDPA